MKKIFCLLALLLFVSPNVLCMEDMTNTAQPGLQIWAEAKPSYLEYYQFDAYNLKMSFVELSSQDYKKLTKKQKKEYKQAKKYNKYISNGQINKVLRKDEKHIPALLASFYNYDMQRQYHNAIISLEKIKQYDQYNLFDREVMNVKLGELYYLNSDYNNCIKYILPVLTEMVQKTNVNDYYYRSMLADSYYNIGDYNKALAQANIIKKDDLPNYKLALLIKYDSYIKLNKNTEANKTAYELYSYSYPSKYDASMYIATTTTNRDTRLKFYNIAKNNTTDSEKILLANYGIATVEQEKLEKICEKSIQGFFKTPNWLDIAKADKDIMTIEQENERFEDYNKEIHLCTSKYAGNNLKSCLNNVIQEQEKITQRLIAEQQERNRQLAEQQRIMQLQQMNYNLQLQNSLIQQQNYQLSQPRYYNSTTTRYGNKYYTNTYSY